MECGRCTEHCPAHFTGKILNPKEIALGVRQYLNEFGPGSRGAAARQVPVPGSGVPVHHLRRLRVPMPGGIQHLPIIVGLRRGAVNTGKWEDDYGTKLFLNLERNGNALGFSSYRARQVHPEAGIPDLRRHPGVLPVAGLHGRLRPAGPRDHRLVRAVMRHLNVSFGVLRKERCTGDPARRLGNDLAFGQLAEANLETLKQSKVKKIVSICPHCVRTIGTDWKEFGEAPPIEHHSEFMARHLDQLAGQHAGGPEDRLSRSLLPGPVSRRL